MTLSFTQIFNTELDVINFRRQAIKEGRVAKARHTKLAQADDSSEAPRHYVTDRKEVIQQDDDVKAEVRGTSRLSGDDDLTGIALSGGGVRSASFCLGVLQALDSLSNHDEPHLLDAVDYLSTVSGGGYIGTSLISGLMQPDYSFPFDSRFDEQETPETQHLRDYSNFLAPAGMLDYLVSAALVLRGLLVNAIIVLPVLLILAVVTVASNPIVDDLAAPDVFGVSISKMYLVKISGLEAFTLTLNVAVLTAALMFASALYTSLTFRRGSLATREALGRALSFLLILVFICFLLELQPFVLAGLFSHSKAPNLNNLRGGAPRDAFAAFAGILPTLAGVLAPAALFLISIAQKLANLAKASLGEATWTSYLKKHGSRLLLYCAALIVPLLLWIAYIYLSYWAIRLTSDDPFGPSTPTWLQTASKVLMQPTAPRSGLVETIYVYLVSSVGLVGMCYLLCALALILVCLLIGPNSNSLHRLYRDRLSRAFLFARSPAGQPVRVAEPDSFKFSALKPFRVAGAASTGAWKRDWTPVAAYAPYLLVNTAINLEASRELNKRGRNADTFIFSPLHVGSRATGYVETADMEARVSDLTLATAMATSGAAASANMGVNTIKLLTFSLSLLNIRLGYWLANPDRLNDLRSWFTRWRANIGTLYFAAETAGWLDENQLNVYLTDGGHIENLGIYELLRRRCKVILAVDAEADPDMTFPSFVSLQVMARIDLGVRIELPWQRLQQAALEVTSSKLYGLDALPGPNGPHGAIGIIRYSDTETGVLIYLKSSLSGDENDYVLDYKRRNPSFPHETTLDQFFSEEQFEAYRSLGFHVARNLLSGADDFASGSLSPTWQADVAAALKLLNIPATMAAAVARRIPH
jgi:patatin-like phospholipase